MRLSRSALLFALGTTVLSNASFGESQTRQAKDELPTKDMLIEEMLVTGGKANIRTLSGSAHLIDDQALEEFDFADINQVLASLPGVYIRQEDGYGLRPNIGLRGVTSDRSQKITLTEDGVLIKPAPYSAPAAYYVPNIARMSAIEVVKGPPTIKQGPNNVGGAINLATQPIPEQQLGFIDVGIGSDGYEKYQLFYGNRHGEFGYWVDFLRYGSDGFKELDNGDDTGFERNDINTKLQWSPESLWGYSQLFTVKLGYADEESDETYLGLTQADFDVNPLRRYAASQLDRFTSEHRQVHFDHLIVFSDNFKLNSKIYWNHFERAWNRLTRFADDTPIDTVLEPSANNQITRQLDILRGDVNSIFGSDEDTLLLTDNDREYYSRGIQFKADYTLDHGDWLHEFEIGLRFHQDEIKRDHAITSYLVTDGTLIEDGISRDNDVLNEAETDAVAIYISDTIVWNDWTFNTGVRYENIESEAEDFLNGSSNEKSQSYVAPGIGAFWQFTEELGFLFGVNKGFSPAGATSGQEVDPEEATNFEYGLRYNNDIVRAEVIGFFSDYDNLIGRCRASDSGCNVGEEFNGDNAEIAGVEVFGEFVFEGDGDLSFPVSINYTYTESAFQTSFTSSFSQWGDVQRGDELPYLPEHVGRIQAGVKATYWDAFVAVNYQSEMRDQAGRENFDEVLHSDAFSTIDLSASWQPHSNWLVQMSIDNVTDKEAIVSWRPFGARPNKPRTLRARVKYSL